MGLAAVRTGLKNVLDTVEGLRCFDYQVDLPVPPSAVVMMPSEIDPGAVLGNGTDYMIGVRLFISRASDRGADEQLEGFLEEMGSGSIIAAIANDPTLDGACMSCDITVLDNIGYGYVGEIPVMTVDVNVQVFT